MPIFSRKNTAKKSKLSSDRWHCSRDMKLSRRSKNIKPADLEQAGLHQTATGRLQVYYSRNQTQCNKGLGAAMIETKPELPDALKNIPRSAMNFEELQTHQAYELALANFNKRLNKGDIKEATLKKGRKFLGEKTLAIKLDDDERKQLHRNIAKRAFDAVLGRKQYETITNRKELNYCIEKGLPVQNTHYKVDKQTGEHKARVDTRMQYKVKVPLTATVAAGTIAADFGITALAVAGSLGGAGALGATAAASTQKVASAFVTFGTLFAEKMVLATSLTAIGGLSVIGIATAGKAAHASKQQRKRMDIFERATQAYGPDVHPKFSKRMEQHRMPESDESTLNSTYKRPSFEEYGSVQV